MARSSCFHPFHHIRDTLPIETELAKVELNLLLLEVGAKAVNYRIDLIACLS
jgi:hypothetical protein